MKRRLSLAIAAALLAPGAALAHVTAQPSKADAGAYTQVAFRVGHGCSGKATTALRLQIPPSLPEVRARPVPGWKVATEKSPDGRTTAVTWRGRLPDEQFEVFELLFKAPAEAGTLTFDVVQTCGRDEAKWNPSVEVLPAAAVDPHAGHHH